LGPRNNTIAVNALPTTAASGAGSRRTVNMA
jgi:hypothetical protein